MTPLVGLVQVGLYALMAVSLLAAVGVVTFRNIFHSALALAVTLLGVAGVFLALRAEFIAIVQILLYVGAVMTLVIFVVMLTHRLGSETIPQKNTQSLPAFVTLVLFVALIGLLILKTDWRALTHPSTGGAGVDRLAGALFGEYVFPFEVVSVILIAALVGAIVIARRDE